MTKEEFLKLDYGNIVTCKRYPGEVYEIDDTDVFGVGDRDPIFRDLVQEIDQTIKIFG